ncbi:MULTISPECIES: hypothetical protein [unclassified Acinetobacter]|uniref:hypothetical protein n=1 Tax=unclassified Acinetobacter TaxID=196816 RepID=UPI0015D2A9F0|nr:MULTISPECIES: hypothetical protein [unclassified Acinetobacter]UUS57051.1 hypothetical protein MST16_13500 [Acinetobacter sp. YH16040_T]
MDDNSKQVELHKQHTALVEKTTFMFLTAATASIGFILTQLKQVIWSDLIWLIIGSLLFLALSFIFGSAQLGHKANFLKFNSEYLSLLSKKSSTMDEAKLLVKNFENAANKLTSTSKWQKMFLFLGAVLYFIYSILDIYLKSVI